MRGAYDWGLDLGVMATGDLDLPRQRVLSVGGMRIGHTASGAPSVGGHHAGDVNVDLAGPQVEVCTADGTPGTWKRATGVLPLIGGQVQFAANANLTVYVGNVSAIVATSLLADDVNNGILVPCAGTVTDLYVRASSAPGSGQSFAATAYVGGSASDITATISGGSATTASDTTHTASVSAGELVSVQLVASSGTAQSDVAYALGFKPT